MRIRRVSGLLGIVLVVMAGAEERPSMAEAEIGFQFDAVVDADRASVQGLIPVVSGLLVEALCEPGALLQRGDPIIVWDPSLMQDAVALRQLDFQIAQTRFALAELNADRELQDLETERDEKAAQLAVIQAKLIRLRLGDRDQLDLLRGQLRSKELGLARQQTQLAGRERLFALGDISGQVLDRKQLALQQAQVQQEVARTELRVQEAGPDGDRIRELLVRERRLRMEIGLDDDNQPIDFGINKRLDNLAARTASEKAKAKAEWDRAEREFHKAKRDAWDHTPIRWIRISDQQGRVVHAVYCSPREQDGAIGERDAGLAFDAERGYGWDQDRQGDLQWRSGAVAGGRAKRAGQHRPGSHSGQAGHGGKRGKAGKQAGRGSAMAASGPFGVMLVRGQAEWRCRLPAGEYQVEVGVGDQFDWQGSRLAVGEGCFAYWAELPPGEQRASTTVRLTGEDLRLRFGDRYDKAMRAPGTGIGKVQDWVHVGKRSRRGGWPYAYFTPADQLRVRGVVHQDLVSLLRSQATAGTAMRAEDTSAQGRIAAAQAALATDQIHLRAAGGWRGIGRVIAVDQQPVTLHGPRDTGTGDAKDLIGREVVIAVTSEEARQLRLGEGVACTVQIAVRDQDTVLPGHLVHTSDQGPVVSEAGEHRQITAFRVADRWVVLDSVAAVDRLTLPDPNWGRLDEQGFSVDGSVLAAERTLVTMAEGWGRIATMAEEGSWVEKDEIVVSLRNPYLENRKDEAEEARRKARQDFLLAVQERRLKAVEAQLQHADHALQEREKRQALDVLREVDEVALASAFSSWRSATMQAELDGEHWQQQRDIDSLADRRKRQAERRAQRSALKAQKQHLKYVAALRAMPWLDERSALIDWQAALATLSLRDGALQLARHEEEVSRLISRDRLRRALEGGRWEQYFNKNKDIRTPVSGRIFYLKGWNDHTRTMTKISENFSVWSGMSVAEVIDPDRLGMNAELPERLYGSVKVGDQVSIVFDQFGRIRIDGRIDQMGEDFRIAADAARDEVGKQAVGLHRVFSVRATFEPPPALRDKLVPGTKGRMVLP